MSSYLFSIMSQSHTGSDWNWFLIFIIFVVVLVIALVIQARFSKDEVAELEHHEEETHHEEAALTPSAAVLPEPESDVESEAEPKPEPEVASQPEEPETPTEPDDLKKLEGIGPKVAGLLNENGITTFAQLADTSVEKLEEILDANKLQMMHPGSWPKQAELAAAGDWEALEKLQDELQGGR
jgi:predicted flap endonuclease-1-like 5' DNA nuclease